MTPDQATIDTFRRDGVVALRGAFDSEWLEQLGRLAMS